MWLVEQSLEESDSDHQILKNEKQGDAGWLQHLQTRNFLADSCKEFGSNPYFPSCALLTTAENTEEGFHFHFVHWIVRHAMRVGPDLCRSNRFRGGTLLRARTTIHIREVLVLATNVSLGFSRLHCAPNPYSGRSTFTKRIQEPSPSSSSRERCDLVVH